jgi:hypothetical protein
MRNRHDVPWLDEEEAKSIARDPLRDSDGAPTGDEPEWLCSPRRRMNYCIRRRVRKLRATREMRAEYRTLREAA